MHCLRSALAELRKGILLRVGYRPHSHNIPPALRTLRRLKRLLRSIKKNI